MRALRLVLFVIAGLVGTLAILECVLRLLPVGGSGVYGADNDPGWPVHHLVPRGHYVHSSGWQLANVHRGVINNFGYVAPFDYVRQSAGIVVLGDSFIESLMNVYAETLQGRLPGLLNHKETVMQFGTSAASMVDYLGILRLASQNFRPTWAVVLFTKGDFTEGFSADDGYFEWKSGDADLIRLNPVKSKSQFAKWARTLAIIRYVRYNLRVPPSRLFAPKHPTAPQPAATGCANIVLSDKDRTLITRYAQVLPAAAALRADHVILVFDSDRGAIYGDHAAACPSRDSAAQSLLKSEARHEGVHVLETDDLFRSYYERTGERVDYSPVDQHWNGIAHRLVAESVASVINNAEQ